MAPSLEDLPAEILSCVAEWLYRIDHRNPWSSYSKESRFHSLSKLRLVSKKVEMKTRHTFAHTYLSNIRISLSHHDLQKLIEISKNETFAPAVTGLNLTSRNLLPCQIEILTCTSVIADEKEQKQKVYSAMAEEQYLKSTGYARELLTIALGGLVNCSDFTVSERVLEELGFVNDGAEQHNGFDRTLWSILTAAVIESGRKPSALTIDAEESGEALHPLDFYIPTWQHAKFCESFSNISSLDINVVFDSFEMTSNVHADKDFTNYLLSFLNAIPTLKYLEIALRSEPLETIGLALIDTALEKVNLPNLEDIQIHETQITSASLNQFLKNHQSKINDVGLDDVTMDSWKETLKCLYDMPGLRQLEIMSAKCIGAPSDLVQAIINGWSGDLFPGDDEEMPVKRVLLKVLSFFDGEPDLPELDEDDDDSELDWEEYGVVMEGQLLGLDFDDDDDFDYGPHHWLQHHAHHHHHPLDPDEDDEDVDQDEWESDDDSMPPLVPTDENM